jgi:hypothetical protein
MTMNHQPLKRWSLGWILSSTSFCWLPCELVIRLWPRSLLPALGSKSDCPLEEKRTRMANLCRSFATPNPAQHADLMLGLWIHQPTSLVDVIDVGCVGCV